MTELTIIDELKTLLPPLSTEEYTGLEADILNEGCLSPLIAWNGILVDGHYRYEICMKHGIPFAVRNIKFNSVEDAKVWAWQHQEHRRNLTSFQRVELALKLKDVIAKKAKERQRLAGGRGGDRVQGSPIDTASELSKIAGVSARTLRKAEHIVTLADEETKDRLRRGDKGTSIHSEYRRLTLNESPDLSVNKPIASYEPPAVVKEETAKVFIRKNTTPVELATLLVAHYSGEFIDNLVPCLLKLYRRHYGAKASQHFLRQIVAQITD
jgi:ParB-like chromosome segregation protein Spo0J